MIISFRSPSRDLRHKKSKGVYTQRDVQEPLIRLKRTISSFISCSIYACERQHLRFRARIVATLQPLVAKTCIESTQTRLVLFDKVITKGIKFWLLHRNVRRGAFQSSSSKGLLTYSRSSESLSSLCSILDRCVVVLTVCATSRRAGLCSFRGLDKPRP